MEGLDKTKITAEGAEAETRATNIMIISKGSAFMTDALEKALEKEGLNSFSAEPEMQSIEKHRDETDIYLLYGGDFVFDATEFFVYLKDLCIEDEKPLCIVGYEKELVEIRDAVPEQYISREFKRPIDMKQLASVLVDLAKKDEERRKGKHILLVDDDPAFLKIMQDWLSMKYNITPVRSGMQAITYIANHKPDLILLDYDMPITPGPQVMEMIRSEHDAKEIPIIFLTGKSDKESVMTVMALKPQGYLLKSTKKEDIMAAVDHFFETKKWENAL